MVRWTLPEGVARRVAGRAAVAGVAGVMVLGGVAAPMRAASARAQRPSTEWTVYHGAPDGAGVATDPVDLAKPARAWHSTKLDGSVYGEPLEAAGRVIVATENDTVYALSARSGAVLWRAHLATPVPSGDLPCGNISPTVGVTGTPVVDLARSEVFVVADELVGGRPAHRLVGLDLYDGRVVLDKPVDPPGAEAAALLQRTGLTLDGDRVVFGMGGNYGDCGPYHGWVVSAPADGKGSILRYDTTPRRGDRQGAVWMGGAAPEVGRAGDLWVAVGNGAAVSGPFDGSDSVVELGRSLHELQVFAPGDWGTDNANDRDLGSTAPALLADGDVVQVGKSDTAYLLDESKLGGVGGELSSIPACDGTDADGGDAVLGDVVYVACQSGVVALATGRRSVAVRWDAASTAASSGAPPDKPPIIAAGLLWSIGGETLYGLNPRTGAVSVRLTVGSNADDFPTPSVADGLLLVTGGDEGDVVVAFAGAAGRPPGPTPAPSSAASSAGLRQPAR